MSESLLDVDEGGVTIGTPGTRGIGTRPGGGASELLSTKGGGPSESGGVDAAVEHTEACATGLYPVGCTTHRSAV